MSLAANLNELRKLLGAQRAFDFLLPLKGDPLDECLRPKRSHSPNFDQFVRFKSRYYVAGTDLLQGVHDRRSSNRASWARGNPFAARGTVATSEEGSKPTRPRHL